MCSSSCTLFIILVRVLVVSWLAYRKISFRMSSGSWFPFLLIFIAFVFMVTDSWPCFLLFACCNTVLTVVVISFVQSWNSGFPSLAWYKTKQNQKVLKLISNVALCFFGIYDYFSILCDGVIFQFFVSFCFFLCCPYDVWVNFRLFCHFDFLDFCFLYLFPIYCISYLFCASMHAFCFVIFSFTCPMLHATWNSSFACFI